MSIEIDMLIIRGLSIAAQLVGRLEGLDLEAKFNALGGFELTGAFWQSPCLTFKPLIYKLNYRKQDK